MKLGLGKTIVKSKLDSVTLRLGIGIGSSIIDVTVRKSPYIIKFFGDLAYQRGGVVARERC